MAIHISNSPGETAALGVAWGREARAGQVIGLVGDLGAGKTQLVKGLAEGLGIGDPIQSPTFALVNEYRTGRLPLFHLDLYRLDTRDQVIGAGLEEYLVHPEGVVVVEWIDRWYAGQSVAVAMSGVSYREVRIGQTSEQARRIDYADFGP